jgi:hypothetical protein
VIPGTTFSSSAPTKRADYLITGNLRHFPKFQEVNMVIALREFITLTAPHSIATMPSISETSRPLHPRLR